MTVRILHILARAVLLAVLLSLAWARTAGAQRLRDAVAPGGDLYWVDQHHARADDRNPGTEELPWKTIGRAASALEPGDAVVVRKGIYRERVEPRKGGTGPDRRITYMAFPGEEVVISGADFVNSGWERYSGAWKHAWTTPLAAYGEKEFRREMVIVDGRTLLPVYSLKELKAGTFFVEGSDRNPAAIYMMPGGKSGLEGRQIEVAVRHPLFSPEGDSCGDEDQPGWLHVAGFTFRHAVNRAQWGAVCAGSEGSLFENNTVEWTNGLGIDVSGRNHEFRGNRALDNGQMGFGGSCTGCLLTGNESSRNNWKGHSPFWEAGGGKFVRTRNTIIRNHTARDNDGPGIWFDIDNEDNTIEYSRLTGNSVAGILLELATVRTVVRGNLVLGTRWVGWSGSGLLAQAASHNVIVENTFGHNAGSGVWIRLDPDRRATDGYNLIYNNLFVANATTAEGDAREISVRGYDLDHARTNRLDGNVYWPHAGSMRISTFYFAPDSSREANFRSDDLAEWRELTGSDERSVLLKPNSQVFDRLQFLPHSELPIGSSGVGVTAPLPLEVTTLTHRITVSQ